MGYYCCRALVLLVMAVVVADLCVAHVVSDCSNNVGAITRTYDVTSWSGQWEFTGFGIGPSSGDYYYLLSYSTDSE